MNQVGFGSESGVGGVVFHNDSNLDQSGGPKKMAMQFALRGVPVIPVHYPIGQACSCRLGIDCGSKAKHPITKSGLKDSSVDLMQIEAWWKNRPDANLGVITGSASGLVVLDIDMKNGGLESYKELERKFGNLKVSRWSRTGGGGFHIYYAMDSRFKELQSRTGILPGVDFKADGGYVVAPPSKHISGNRYQWDESCLPYAVIPENLLNFLMREKKTMKKLEHAGQRPLESQLTEVGESRSDEVQLNLNGESSCQELSIRCGEKQVSGSEDKSQDDETAKGRHTVKIGGRNNTLTSLGGLLRRLGWQQGDIFDVLQYVNQNKFEHPVSFDETSGISKGLMRYKAIDWKAPISISQHATYAPSLEQNLLPDALSDFFEETARILQVPLDYLVVPNLVALSSIVARKVTIKPLNRANWKVVPNLWGMLVADPGTLKSPAIAEALDPIYKLTNKAREEWDKATQDRKKAECEWKLKIDDLKLQIKESLQSSKNIDVRALRQELHALESQPETNEPIEDRVFFTDATVEKIAAILSNQSSMLLVRDELSGWLMGLQKNGREGDREFYLEAWNGNQPFRIERVGRGAIHVPRLCLSVFGGIQPQKLAAYIDSTCENGTDDGFLERFQLLVAPSPLRQRLVVNEKLPEHLSARLDDLFRHVYEKLNVLEDSFCLQFSDHAQPFFTRWLQNLENRLASSYPLPIMRAHLSKYRSLMPTLAGLFAIIDGISRGKDLQEIQMQEKEVNLASAWCDYLERHAWSIYSPHLSSALKPALALAERIKAGEIRDNDFVRSILRAQWSGLSKLEDVQQGLEFLETLNWVKLETARKLGRPSAVVRVNPSLSNL